MPSRIKVINRQTKSVKYLQFAGHPVENMLTDDKNKAPWWIDGQVKDLAGWLARNNPDYIIEIDKEKAPDDVQPRGYKKPVEVDLDFGNETPLESPERELDF